MRLRWIYVWTAIAFWVSLGVARFVLHIPVQHILRALYVLIAVSVPWLLVAIAVEVVRSRRAGRGD